MTTTRCLSIVALCAASAAGAETRQMHAHEHGVGDLSIAIEGASVVMELLVPGADIVGFEYAAQTDADKAKIDAAIAVLADPVALFGVPTAAGCGVDTVEAHLHGDDHHEHEHEHEHKDHGDHKHGDHKHDKHTDHAHDHGDAHKEHSHEHKDHDHKTHAHDHADHGDTHSEFHAMYELTCADPSALDALDMTYFATFPNAEKLNVQIATADGASMAEVTRDAPVLALGGRY